MPDPVICPACSAVNPSGSEWCGQCFASFAAASAPPGRTEERVVSSSQPDSGPTGPVGAPTGPPGGPPPPRPRPDRPAPGPVPTPRSTAGESPDGWTCGACGSVNSVAVDVCGACDTSIYDTFGAGDDERPSVEPATAALWGLLPGGGHFKVGQSALGLAVAGLLLVGLLFGLLMVGGNRWLVGIVLLVFTVVTWAISIFDATRFAAHDDDAVLLRPKVITSAMGLVFALVIIAAVSITGDRSTP